jgi:hypothetical protein
MAGPQRGSKARGLLRLPDTISDREQDHTSKSEDQEAHLGKQTPLLAVSSSERDELTDHPRQAAPLPLRAQASSLAPSLAHKPPFKAGIKVRHAKFGERIVQKCEVVSGTMFVEVQFRAGMGRKRLSMDFDRLERA